MKNFQFIFLIGFILLFTNCKKEGGNGDSGNDFVQACCEVPPLDECYKGVGIFVPNAFTPNSDGVNDLLRIYKAEGAQATGFQDIVSWEIQDASGKIVFSISNIPIKDSNGRWDGTDGNGNVLEGVFQYDLKIRAEDGVILAFNGAVCCRPGIPRPCVDNEKKCAYGSQHDGAGRFYTMAETGELDCE